MERTLNSSTLFVQVTNGKTGFLAYETRFWFPSEESKSFSPFYYSYEVHSGVATSHQAHFAKLDKAEAFCMCWAAAGLMRLF